MRHIPVLFEETLRLLNVKAGGVYLDMTLGGFGHGSEICRRIGPEGTYIGLDRDESAVEAGRQKANAFPNRCVIEHADFRDFANVLERAGIRSLDGALMDLGISSIQLDDPTRGFSFQQDGPLDMRMDQSRGINAAQIVNEYSEDALSSLIRDYGEERYHSRIANSIVRERKQRPILTTFQLAHLIDETVPKKGRTPGRNVATRTFQALRIEANGELDGLGQTVESVCGMLKEEGRLCAISFHSLEDREVKSALASLAKGCTCPKDFPVCVCGKKPSVKILTKKPVTAGEEEIKANPRSRSARLRGAEKLSTHIENGELIE